jgi:hypothetical protein
MKHYKENDTVIFTDKDGNHFDTFVIFDTDRETGLTHINHYNLRVPSSALELHPSSLTGNQAPLADSYSFLLFNKLKEKYAKIDEHKVVMKKVIVNNDAVNKVGKLAKAS